MASGTSLRSGSSGQQSEIDSLVEAISSDHMHGRNELARAISHSPRADKPKQVVPPSSPGSINIEGSQFPLRPVRVQDSELDSSTAWQRSRASQTREASQRDPTAAPLTPPETPSEVGPNADAPTSTTWQPIPSQRPPLTPQQALPKLNVLIVEDDPINRAILHKKLVKEGHTVITSVHGDEAVRKFEEDSTYDIVLMDLQCVSAPILCCSL